jgi:acyl-CoA reductase-like NAD-dependent aldehyde dehydrogenase
LTGSSEAGYAAQAICARRRIPLQAELGGNNAAIVWSDCDLAAAAGAIAEGGFGAAGQRCTANRRVIVDRRCHGEFLAELEAATGALEIGDPTDPAVQIGPLVSEAALERVEATLERALSGCEVREPLADRELIQQLRERGPYAAPVLVLCEDAAAEIVQEETFGPVVVVQPAADFDQALELLNGVRQGLVAALFSSSQELRVRFLDEADAGVLKINRATADVGVEAPFGGRKASGVGPPEHGAENQAFYTRVQAVYS